MRGAAAAVGAAEAGDRDWQIVERGVEGAFVAAFDDVGAEQARPSGELVDMPMHALVFPHVPRQSRPQSAGASRRAAIEIIAGGKRRYDFPDANVERRVETQRQRIARRASRARRRRRRQNSSAYSMKNPERHPLPKREAWRAPLIARGSGQFYWGDFHASAVRAP